MKNDSTLPLHPCWLDSELTLRCLTPADRAVHQAMSRVICQALPNEDWLIPLSQEEYDTIFAAGSDDVVYGIFRGDRLIGTSSLVHDVSDLAVIPLLEEILRHPCIEVSECMVLPEYRGRGLMLQLNRLIQAESERQGIRYLLATAHPDNVPSNTSLCHLGFRIIGEITRFGKRRNLLVMEI